MGLSEGTIEMLIGGLPGGAGNVPKGWLSYVKSSLSEAGEEAFQTYVTRGFECMATGEPYDLLGTTKEAGEAGWMAIWTSAAMSGGGKVVVKAGDVIIETTPSEFNSYQEWRDSIDSDFRKTHPAVADILFGNVNKSVFATFHGSVSVRYLFPRRAMFIASLRASRNL